MTPEKHDPRRDRAKDGSPTSSYIESQGPQQPEDGTALEGLGKQNEQGELSMDKDYKPHDIHATAS